jgi:hypothetical protein
MSSFTISAKPTSDGYSGEGVDAYSAEAWAGLCAAAAAASAALAGLVFVGVSINLKEIMAYAWLPNRALEAIVLLLLVLLTTMLVLAPGQPAWALGLEILVVTLPAWAIVALVHRKAIGIVPKEFRGPLLLRIIAGEAAVLPFAVAGVTLLLHAGGGLYWLLPAVTLANAVGVYNAWVLLIEIVR